MSRAFSLASSRDGLEEHRLRVLGGQAADLLESRHALRLELAEVLALALEVELALEELPVPLLEHVGPLVQLLVAGDQAALLRRELIAARARLVLRLTLEADLLFLGLQDQVLLLGPRIREDPAGLFLGDLDRLVREPAATHEPQGHANGETADQPQKGDADVFHLRPPIRPPSRPDACRSFGAVDAVVGSAAGLSA